MSIFISSRRAALVGAFGLLAGFAGCANTPGAAGQAAGDKPALDSTQQAIKVDVLGSNGAPLAGYTCRLANDHGFVLAQSGSTAVVKRSERDLEISCEAPGAASAQARLIGRVAGTQTVGGSRTSMGGHIAIGSGGSRSSVGIGIGFPIVLGEARPAQQISTFRYADWVQLQAGKSLLIDAPQKPDGKPAAAIELAKP